MWDGIPNIIPGMIRLQPMNGGRFSSEVFLSQTGPSLLISICPRKVWWHLHSLSHPSLHTQLNPSRKEILPSAYSCNKCSSTPRRARGNYALQEYNHQENVEMDRTGLPSRRRRRRRRIERADGVPRGDPRKGSSRRRVYGIVIRKEGACMYVSPPKIPWRISVRKNGRVVGPIVRTYNECKT